MRVFGMAFLCARRGVSWCRCWPPASPSCRAALSLCFFCSFSLGCLSCRAHRRCRAPCVFPLFLSVFPLPRLPSPSPPVTPFLPSSPPIRLTLMALSVLFRPPSLPLRFFHPCVRPVGPTHALLCCPYLFPRCRVVPSPCPLCCSTVPYHCALPSFPESLPIRDAMGSWRGGGFTCEAGSGRSARLPLWYRRPPGLLPDISCI